MLAVDGDERQIADISTVEKLTSLSDISRLLHETLAKERGLEAELDQLLNRRGELEKSLIDLHAGSREVVHTQFPSKPDSLGQELILLLISADSGSSQGRG